MSTTLPIPEAGREELILALGAQINILLVSSRAVLAQSAQRFDPDLQPAAFQIAQWLALHGPANANRVADALGMDKSAISRLTKSLSALNILQSALDPQDRRGVIHEITPEGRERVAVANQAKTTAFLDKLAGWEKEDLAVFAGLLARFNTRA